jgi:sulfur-oxidizing protein SoxY
MTRSRTISVVGRRDVLIGATAGAALLALGRRALAADPATKQLPPAPPASLYEQALDKILGDAKPLPGKIAIEIPEIAENGNTVPYAITIESPMTEADHIKAIHVLSTANPLPDIASFGLTPLAGKASVASRMRLAKTQEVVVLAELSNGRFIVAM